MFNFGRKKDLDMRVSTEHEFIKTLKISYNEITQENIDKLSFNIEQTPPQR